MNERNRMAVKPGLRTTEFYVVAGTVIVDAVQALDPNIKPSTAQVVASVALSVVAVGYTFARKGLKAAVALAETDLGANKTADTASVA